MAKMPQSASFISASTSTTALEESFPGKDTSSGI